MIELHLLRVVSGADVSLLSTQERERAARFRFDADRDAFAFARASLRRLLGDRLNVEPRSLVFESGEHGKPYLRGDPLHFNVSHTRDAVAIAIDASALGVDIERVDPARVSLDTIKHYFPADEARRLESLEGAARCELFFALWTAHEARLKASGLGLSLPLPADDGSWIVHRGGFEDHAWALATRADAAPRVIATTR